MSFNQPKPILTMKLRKLETVIECQGFTYTEICRSGNIALYEQLRDDWKSPSYEVIVIKVNKPHPNSVHEFDMVETYPSAMHWGSRGWTFNTMEDAGEKFDELVLKQEVKA